MGFIIDLVLILAFVFSIAVAYKKGLLKSLIDSFGFIASVFFASRIAENVHLWIYETFFKEKIIESVRQEIVASTPNQPTTFFADVKEFLSGFASLTGIDTESISKASSGIDLSAENAAELLTQTAVQPILTVIIKWLVFFVLAVSFIVVLGILGKALSKLIKATPLKGINKFFGGVFGIFKGLVVVLLLIVVIVFSGALIEDATFDSMVSSSKILEILNTNSDIFKIN